MAVVAFVVFLLLYLTPGDPAAILAGDAATSDACTADGQCTDGCTRVAELCNDTDDDCDGLIDEDFERGGQAIWVR